MILNNKNFETSTVLFGMDLIKKVINSFPSLKRKDGTILFDVLAKNNLVLLMIEFGYPKLVGLDSERNRNS